MNSSDVAAYLQEHPEFFEEHAEMIAGINIPHPHGGRTIPISERQILTLREKSKQLEGKLREIIQFGEENDLLGEKIHKITLALLRARDADTVLANATQYLREDFTVPHLAMRVWRGAGTHAAFTPASEATRGYFAAERRLRDLDTRIADLTRMREALGQLVTACCAGDDPHCPILDALDRPLESAQD